MKYLAILAVLASSFIPNYNQQTEAASYSPNLPIPVDYSYDNRKVQAVIDRFDSRTIDGDQLTCLAKVIYHEARGETQQGQLAVALVTINRTKSGLFPDTICKVVYQKGQYQWTWHNPPIYDKNSWEKALTLAKFVILEYNQVVDPTYGALYFGKSYNKNQTIKIGSHYFVRQTGTRTFNMEIENTGGL